jgi:hypothetical protein
VQTGAMKTGKPSFPSVKLFRFPHVRQQTDCEQVAAVCYRQRRDEIQFLLRFKSYPRNHLPVRPTLDQAVRFPLTADYLPRPCPDLYWRIRSLLVAKVKPNFTSRAVSNL